MKRLLFATFLLFTATLLAADAPRVTLAISSPALANKDPFMLTADVTGPYEGGVCFFVGYDEDQQIVSQACVPYEIEVGKVEHIVKDYHVPASAKLGHYSAAVILADARGTNGERIASNIVGFQVTSTTRRAD